MFPVPRDDISFKCVSGRQSIETENITIEPSYFSSSVSVLDWDHIGEEEESGEGPGYISGVDFFG